MTTIQEMRQTLESHNPGLVLIKGKGIDKEIGAGVVKFLLRIPDRGVSEDNLSDYYPSSESPNKATLKKWIKEILLPAGLVYEKKPGIYMVTDAAKNADYAFMSNEKTGSYNQEPDKMFPIPDE